MLFKKKEKERKNKNQIANKQSWLLLFHLLVKEWEVRMFFFLMTKKLFQTNFNQSVSLVPPSPLPIILCSCNGDWKTLLSHHPTDFYFICWKNQSSTSIPTSYFSSFTKLIIFAYEICNAASAVLFLDWRRFNNDVDKLLGAVNWGDLLEINGYWAIWNWAMGIKSGVKQNGQCARLFGSRFRFFSLI